MAKVVGDIAVRVGAEIGPLQKGMGRAGQEVRGFQQRFDRAARSIARSSTIAVGAVAALGAVGLRMAKNAAEAGAEIENLSRVAAATPVTFQRWAYASRTVGIEQDKLADILKDVNDKVGDFMETGGGPMADFFENIAPKVGVTAKQFKALSGPEALQLYVSSLEKAGLSQAQMTFYMEALASDATALLPILQNNGSEVKRLGDEAERTGQVMSNDAVRGSAEMKRELELLTNQISTRLTGVILENKDEIIKLAGVITDTWIPALINAGLWLGTTSTKISEVIEGLKTWKEVAASGVPQWNMNVDPTGGPTNGTSSNDPLDNLGGESPPTDGKGNVITPSRWEKLYGPRTPPPAGGAGGGGGGGGTRKQTWSWVDGMGAPPPEGITSPGGSYEAPGAIIPNYQVRLAKIREQEAEHRERQIEATTEHNETMTKILTSQSEREQKINAEKLAKLAEKEKLARRQRITDTASAFGDLSTLMATENKKLFKIGQAAAIAEATVSGYRAAVEAWEKGMAIGGPPVAAAFTAASLARTGAMISAISSTSSSGGSGAGAGLGGGGVVSAPDKSLTLRVEASPGTVMNSEALIAGLNRAFSEGYRIDKAVVVQ